MNDVVERCCPSRNGLIYRLRFFSRLAIYVLRILGKVAWWCKVYHLRLWLTLASFACGDVSFFFFVFSLVVLSCFCMGTFHGHVFNF